MLLETFLLYEDCRRPKGFPSLLTKEGVWKRRVCTTAIFSSAPLTKVSTGQWPIEVFPIPGLKPLVRIRIGLIAWSLVASLLSASGIGVQAYEKSSVLLAGGWRRFL